MNMQGQIVLGGSEGSRIFSVDISNLPHGLYFLEIQGVEHLQREKIVIR